MHDNILSECYVNDLDACILAMYHTHANTSIKKHLVFLIDISPSMDELTPNDSHQPVTHIINNQYNIDMMPCTQVYDDIDIDIVNMPIYRDIISVNIKYDEVSTKKNVTIRGILKLLCLIANAFNNDCEIYFSIIAFDSIAYLIYEHIKCTFKNITDIAQELIDYYTYTGGTNIENAVIKCIELIQTHRSNDDDIHTSILLLTDGEDNQSRKNMFKYANGALCDCDRLFVGIADSNGEYDKVIGQEFASNNQLFEGTSGSHIAHVLIHPIFSGMFNNITVIANINDATIRMTDMKIGNLCYTNIRLDKKANEYDITINNNTICKRTITLQRDTLDMIQNIIHICDELTVVIESAKNIFKSIDKSFHDVDQTSSDRRSHQLTIMKLFNGFYDIHINNITNKFKEYIQSLDQLTHIYYICSRLYKDINNLYEIALYIVTRYTNSLLKGTLYALYVPINDISYVKENNELELATLNYTHDDIYKNTLTQDTLCALNKEPDHGDDINYINQCILCSSEPRTIIYLPCRHFTTCYKCDDMMILNNIDKCPICREIITMRLNTVSYKNNNNMLCKKCVDHKLRPIYFSNVVFKSCLHICMCARCVSLLQNNIKCHMCNTHVAKKDVVKLFMS
jgi:hypothetical protein